jgi:hypothetical protein
MSGRLETLKKARGRMIEDWNTHAKVLAAPFDRDKAERARIKFTEIQTLIDALDRAISREEAISPKNRAGGCSGAGIGLPMSEMMCVCLKRISVSNWSPKRTVLGSAS